MQTRKTSFGRMAQILRKANKVLAEYLHFEKNGRNHQHPSYESFFVLSGHGRVVSGDKIYCVQEGDLVTIPPQTDHWMEVDEGQSLEGLLWYHTQPLKTPQHDGLVETIG